MKPVAAIVAKEEVDLKAMAKYIEAAHRAGEASEASALTEFRKAGDLLNKAKEKLGHGFFGQWCRENLTISDRQARRYMAFAKSDVATSEMTETWREIQGNDRDDPEETPEMPQEQPTYKVAQKPDKPAPKRHAPIPEPHHVVRIPDRIKPAFDQAESIRSVVAQIDRLIGPLERIEGGPAWKMAHQGMRATTWTTHLKACRDRLTQIEPKKPCSRGCGEVEPSMEADECPECKGKGYVTLEDESDA